MWNRRHATSSGNWWRHTCHHTTLSIQSSGGTDSISWPLSQFRFNKNVAKVSLVLKIFQRNVQRNVHTMEITMKMMNSDHMNDITASHMHKPKVARGVKWPVLQIVKKIAGGRNTGSIFQQSDSCGGICIRSQKTVMCHNDQPLQEQQRTRGRCIDTMKLQQIQEEMALIEKGIYKEERKRRDRVWPKIK